MYGVVSMLTGGINFLIHLAFLIVVLTLIRTRRPDAWLPLAVAAGIFLLQTVLAMTIPTLLSQVVSHSSSYSVDGYMGAMSGYYVFSALMNGTAWGLLMIGLVKIASPPRELNLNRPPGG